MATSILYHNIILIKRDNSSIISLINVVCNLLRLQCIYQSLNSFAVLIAFLDCDYIHISLCCLRISLLISYGILSYGEACLKCIVTV